MQFHQEVHFRLVAYVCIGTSTLVSMDMQETSNIHEGKTHRFIQAF